MPADEPVTASDGAPSSQEVPSDVAVAARLWASSPALEAPPHAAWIDRMVWRWLWKVVGVGVIVTLAVLGTIKARHLIAMLVVALFFALAIVPGVNALVRRWNMRRGAAVGVIFALALLTVVFMVVVLIPAIVGFADAVQENAAAWFASLNAWTTETFGAPVVDADAAAANTEAFAASLGSWADNVLGAVTSGLGFIFDFFTVAAFTFYFAADFPKLRRAIMARMTPERQHVFAWVTDTSIEQTGGYFYSRLLLMLVNGGLGFGVMVLIGLPVIYALPLALFMGFVSAFIPFIGTYLGAAVPTVIILAVLGVGEALVMLAWVIVYQQIENYVLNPRFSSRTMELSGAVAFGSALAGGAIAGPMGAFMALPVAALVTAIVKNAGKTYAVVVENLDGPTIGKDDAEKAEDEAKPRRRLLRRRAVS